MLHPCIAISGSYDCPWASATKRNVGFHISSEGISIGQCNIFRVKCLKAIRQGIPAGDMLLKMMDQSPTNETGLFFHQFTIRPCSYIHNIASESRCVSIYFHFTLFICLIV